MTQKCKATSGLPEANVTHTFTKQGNNGLGQRPASLTGSRSVTRKGEVSYNELKIMSGNANT